MNDLVQWFKDPSLLALLFMTACVVLVVVSWHRTGKIDLSQCVVDGTTGKLSVEKVGYMTALLTSTWGFVDLSLHDKLTEWYFTAYAGLLIAGRALNTSVNAYKDVKNVPPPSNP
jgi:hypothetical protein